MKFSRLFKFFRTRPISAKKVRPKATMRQRLKSETLPNLVYAIGDVHGCLDLLLDLETQIAADCAESPEPALIIMLGDYVDRGPDTCALIDHLLDPPPFNAKRTCLLGNHEEAMLAFVENPKPHVAWLEFGGKETLISYGLSDDEMKLAFVKKKDFLHKINSFIPQEHIKFLRNLPISASFPHKVFVHAGVRPNVIMEKQSDRDLVRIRSEFLEFSGEREFLVIHGHSPVEEPFVSKTRINIDTGAYITGRLTAAKFVEGDFVSFLTT